MEFDYTRDCLNYDILMIGMKYYDFFDGGDKPRRLVGHKLAKRMARLQTRASGKSRKKMQIVIKPFQKYQSLSN
jgi:hypothetical protein